MANRKLNLKEVHDVERFNNTIRASIVAFKQIEKNLDDTLTAPFDNDFAFDNLIANSKLFNK